MEAGEINLIATVIVILLSYFGGKYTAIEKITAAVVNLLKPKKVIPEEPKPEDLEPLDPRMSEDI